MRGALDIMIGDGKSDFCIARRCDLVLAKGQLREHCRQHGVTHVAIENFSDATRVVSQWLAKGLNPGSKAKRPFTLALRDRRRRDSPSAAIEQPGRDVAEP
jgi:hypothetical protein